VNSAIVAHLLPFERLTFVELHSVLIGSGLSREVVLILIEGSYTQFRTSYQLLLPRSSRDTVIPSTFSPTSQRNRINAYHRMYTFPFRQEGEIAARLARIVRFCHGNDRFTGSHNMIVIVYSCPSNFLGF
jgi:hypothetical protein